MLHPKQSLLFIGVLLISIFSKAQSEFSISGRIVEQNGVTIPFANVVLYTTDSDNVLTGVISEDDGNFTISGIGNVKLEISYVGFKTYEKTLDLQEDIKLGTITLEPDYALEELVITASKPTIQRRVDRLVFNVEETIISSGTALDIIKKTPGVIVTDNSINVRNSRVTVYLNDSKVYLTNEELQSLLNNMSGSIVKSVEVITNPPAQYDAEGGAVLRIITSKNIAAGYKGNVSATGTYAVFPKYEFATNHFYKTDNINLFGSYTYAPRKEYKEVNEYIRFRESGTGNIQSNWESDFNRTTRSNAHNANLIGDFTITNQSSLHITTNLSYSPNIRFKNRALTEIRNANRVLDSSYTTSSALNEDIINAATDATYKYNWGEKQNMFRSNFHYTTYRNDRLQDVSTRYFLPNENTLSNNSFTTDSFQEIDIYAGQIDVVLPQETSNWETGIKTSFIHSKSGITFTNTTGNTTQFIPELSDNFTYNERVLAGYASYTKNWESWNVKIGLRGEHTNSIGKSNSIDNSIELDYFEWFPTTYLQYESENGNSWSIDYSRRIDRPRYNDLNPFSYFVNENNFSTGNPTLVPAITQKVNVNYTFGNGYSLDAYLGKATDYISPLSFQDNENFTLRTQDSNLNASVSYGIDFTHYRSIKDWWFFYTYISAFHEEETFIALEDGNIEVTNDIDGLFAQVYNSFDISDTWTAEVTFQHFTGFIFGNYQQTAHTNLSLGVQKSLWKGRGKLTFMLDDMLNEANPLNQSRYLNQDNGFRAIPETRFARIGFTYNFGNYNLEDNNRDIELQERDRLEQGQ